MAASKNKNVKQKEKPKDYVIKTTKDPDSFNNMHPSWRFSAYDNKIWSFTPEKFTHIIMPRPRLKEWEARTWNEILIHSKKENHSIDTKFLNKIAQERLSELMIEANAVISLRISGTCRLYGYRIGSVFYILWFDNNHGDNCTCVCRSRKKHT